METRPYTLERDKFLKSPVIKLLADRGNEGEVESIWNQHVWDLQNKGIQLTND